ncbi:MAG: VCBS repeat-containing protein [Planctomycetes bacterium]|nr:VCBS repeat-containing protein [Planctomycetota bacterium]
MIAALFLLALSPQPQIVGGGYDLISQWDGQSAGDGLSASASSGDVNGDGYSDIILSAPFTWTAGIGTNGTVFVYSGLDGQLLHSWNGSYNSYDFGESLDSAGDVNGDGLEDVIVGDCSAYPGGVSSVGLVDIYSGADGSLVHRLQGIGQRDYFGYSVAGIGDVNGDSLSDFAINVAGRGNGVIEVYSGLDASLLYAISAHTLDQEFGHSLSSAGDMDGDGYGDFVCGAYLSDPGGVTDAGRAYAFSGIDGSVIFLWEGTAASSQLGRSVAGAGDVNADGVPDVIVGVPWDSSNGLPYAGSAIVYSGADGTQLFHWTGENDGDQLGDAVSGAGDVNGDGFGDLVIGAPKTDPNGMTNGGSSYLFSGADGSLLAKWDGVQNDLHGLTVASAGDTNQNGLDEVLVGTPYADPNGMSSAGSAYLYGFKSFLQANTQSISSSAGGLLELDLDFPAEAGGANYKVLISATGTGPTFYGVDIPLTLDSLVIDTYYGIYPIPSYTDLHGVLDNEGDGQGVILAPSGFNQAPIGRTFYFAAIVSSPSGRPGSSSVAVPVAIVP